MTTMESEYEAKVRTCAEQGKRLMQMLTNNGSPETLYLYARESVPGKPGELFLVRDSAPNVYDYKLVTPEGLRINVPYDRYYQWVWERARSAKILSIEPVNTAATNKGDWSGHICPDCGTAGQACAC